MFKTLLNFILSFFVFYSDYQPLPTQTISNKSFFQLSAKDLLSQIQISFSKYSNKKVFIIVNVACQCGYTKDNYEQLMQLYRQYKNEGLQILAFPCNQFANQQNGTQEQISSFVYDNFKITFPMFEKISVNGQNIHPVYVYLKKNSQLYDKQTKKAKQIPWNFSKFIVDSKGKVIGFYPPTVQTKIIEQQIKRILLKTQKDVDQM